MIAGQRGQVVAERFTMHGLKEIQFDVGSTAGVLKADISTKSHLSSAPLVRDPYEATMIDVKKSTIEKAGDGVFLKGFFKTSGTQLEQ